MTRTESEVRQETFRAQLAAARALLAERGVTKRMGAPPVHRMLWLAGVRLPPPAFCSFALNAALLGAYFAVLWGGIMWVFLWSTSGMHPLAALLGATAAGLAFGMAMAVHNRSLRRKHDLPSWESFARPADPTRPQRRR